MATKRSHTFRFDPAELAEWRREAQRRGIGLTAFLAEAANANLGRQAVTLGLPPRLSDREREMLVMLFRKEHASMASPPPVGPDAQAAMMAFNTPAVARKWLEDEGLLDEQHPDPEPA